VTAGEVRENKRITEAKGREGDALMKRGEGTRRADGISVAIPKIEE